MAWTIKVKHTRPNTGVDWFVGTPGHWVNDYIEDKYDDTGKRISLNASLSENGLEVTTTVVFRDESAKNEYWLDSQLVDFIDARNTYNTSNSISKTLLQNEET